MVISVVAVSHYLRLASQSRHRDEKPVTATPLDSAFTNCDAHNPFRMRSYENCRVAYPSTVILNARETLSRKKRICKSLVSFTLRTLSFSVSCNSCICHSYENTGVYTNSSHSGTVAPAPTQPPLLSALPLRTQRLCVIPLRPLFSLGPKKKKGGGRNHRLVPPSFDSVELCSDFGLTTRGLSDRPWPASPRFWPAPWRPHPASAFSASWSGSAPCRQWFPCSRTDPRWFARP